MWAARDKDGTLRLWIKNKPHRPSAMSLWAGAFCVDGHWQGDLDDGIQIHFSMFPELTWEDEPIECGINLYKHLTVCPKCGKRIWYDSDDIHYEHSEEPWSGYREEWEWLECPECKTQIEV